jgi:tight adherence protein C
MLLLLIVILTFTGLMLTVMSIYFIFARPTSTMNARLESIDPSLALIENNPITVMAGRMADPINRIIPISAVEALKIQKKLLQAGYRSPEAATAFRAIQVTMLVAIPSLVMTACFLLNRSLSDFAVFGMLGAAVGFYLPRYVLYRKTKGRQQRITWGLADALDLMVVAVEAGLGLNAALNRVGDELKSLHPDMHVEIELVNLEIRVGRSREEALRNLAERTGVEDIRAFVAYGSSIAKAVRIFADSLRTKRRQRAEQIAQKAALKLLFPLTFFLFPVIILIVLGSALLNLYDVMFK